MKPAAFEYFRPRTVDEALDLLERHNPDIKIIAGGQSLVPLMNFRLAKPRCLIDANAIEGLSYVEERDGHLAVGAMVRHSEIENSDLIADRCPLIVEATRHIGHRTIRNRATIGGSLAHADPSAEYPTVMTALEGEVVVRGKGGERTIPARDLFVSICTTSLASNELLTEVRLPILPPGTGWAFEELNRRHGDYAIVGAAVILSMDQEGRFGDVRIALAGVDLTPIRCGEAENALIGNPPADDAIRVACEKCSAAAEPTDDIHSSASYKRAMVAVIVDRAIRNALRRTGRE